MYQLYYLFLLPFLIIAQDHSSNTELDFESIFEHSIMLSHSENGYYDFYTDELITNNLHVKSKEDILKYGDLEDKYTTELQRKVFYKTEEFSLLVEKINTEKKDILQKWYRLDVTVTGKYDMKSKFIFRNFQVLSEFTKEKAKGLEMGFVLFPSLKKIIKEKINEPSSNISAISWYYYFDLPMNEETALIYEEKGLNDMGGIEFNISFLFQIEKNVVSIPNMRFFTGEDYLAIAKNVYMTISDTKGNLLSKFKVTNKGELLTIE